jgi:hypothetical protein
VEREVGPQLDSVLGHGFAEGGGKVGTLDERIAPSECVEQDPTGECVAGRCWVVEQFAD